MGRPSTIQKYIGKDIGGIKILKPLGLRGEVPQRMWVECQCLSCGKIFEAVFHNVYKGGYKSCGCLRFSLASKNPRWKGCGKISRSIFNSLERGAEGRGLEFSVDIEYLWRLFTKQKGKCIFTGASLSFPRNRKDTSQTASLDRKNPRKGYIRGNLQWIKKDLNYMKQSMTDKEFITAVKDIYEYRIQQ